MPKINLEEPLKNFRHKWSARESGSWQESNNNGICKTYTTDDGAILNWWVKNRTINFQGSPDVRIAFETAFYGNDNVENTDAPVVRRATRQPNNRTKIFIVHGHDQGSLDQLELILRRLELAPYILQNNTAQSNTLIEALEQEIYDKNTVFGIVLMTPDDFGYSKNESDDKRKPRARQNVILEMGMVMASLGRNKTVILKRYY